MTLLRFLLSVSPAVFLPAQTLEVTRVVATRAERKSRLPAELQPYMKVDIYARVTGFVEHLEVDRGSTVLKGQLLATLVAPEMASQLAAAEARVLAAVSQRAEAAAKVVAAESTYERLKEAARTPGVVAGNELVLAEKAVESAGALVKALEGLVSAARASVQALRELEGYLRITAPFDGTITRRHAHPGALLGPAAGTANSPVVTLEQNSRLRLVVPVPEADVAGTAKGIRVPFTVPAHPGRTFHGVVARIPNSIDSATRTMAVELDVANESGALAPGMYSEVQWPVRGPRPSLMVPPASIVTTTERSFVIRVREGRAEWVDVRRGQPAGDLVEVFGGLKQGEEVVTRASDEIRNGSPVRVRAAK